MTAQEAKSKLDRLIAISRVHLYKPIQIAEILHRHRSDPSSLDLRNLETYRNRSKQWRDEISVRLLRQRSTSSQKYQDNLFEANAIPPPVLAKLAEANQRTGGAVEVYIYQAFTARQQMLSDVAAFLARAKPATFVLRDLIAMFVKQPGLRRSVDKIYEIVVYALFESLVEAMNARVSLSVPKENVELVREFEGFTRLVLGISPEQLSISAPARLYRAGVTNAADRGLDIWCNFGPAVQVKHLTLTDEIAEELVEQITADSIVIVCKDAEEEPTTRILNQLGWKDRVRGVITQSELEEWYEKALRGKHKSRLADNLIKYLRMEFRNEFPRSSEIAQFMQERGYDKVAAVEWWADAPSRAGQRSR